MKNMNRKQVRIESDQEQKVNGNDSEWEQEENGKCKANWKQNEKVNEK